MRVLSVNIQQVPSRFAQLLQGRTATIDKTARTPSGIKCAAKQTLAFIVVEILLFQPGLQKRQLANIKFSTDLGTLTPCTHHAAITALPQSQRQGINQN